MDAAADREGSQPVGCVCQKTPSGETPEKEKEKNKALPQRKARQAAAACQARCAGSGGSPRASLKRLVSHHDGSNTYFPFTRRSDGAAYCFGQFQFPAMLDQADRKPYIKHGCQKFRK